MTDELRHGDRIELRGPVGGYFVWEPSQGGPLLLVAGGSGVVPLMAMIRARDAAGSDTETRLLFSSRGWDDVIYRDELERLRRDGLTVVHTLTRSQPPGWTGYARRVDAEMLAEVGPSPDREPACLRLWPDALRGGGGTSVGAARARAADGEDRALRTDRRLRWTH